MHDEKIPGYEEWPAPFAQINAPGAGMGSHLSLILDLMLRNWLSYFTIDFISDRKILWDFIGKIYLKCCPIPFPSQKCNDLSKHANFVSVHILIRFD